MYFLYLNCLHMLLQAAHNKTLRESWENLHPALSNQTSNLCGIVGDNAINTPVKQLFYDIQAIDLFFFFAFNGMDDANTILDNSQSMA